MATSGGYFATGYFAPGYFDPGYFGDLTVAGNGGSVFFGLGCFPAMLLLDATGGFAGGLSGGFRPLDIDRNFLGG